MSRSRVITPKQNITVFEEEEEIDQMEINEPLPLVEEMPPPLVPNHMIDIDEKHIWEILKNKFDGSNRALIDHQISTFEEFVERGLQKIIEEESEITVSVERTKRYTVSFGQVYVPPVCTINEKRKLVPILPHEARMRDMTYETPVQVDIIEKWTDSKGIQIEEPKLNRRVTITHIPVMLGSSRCRLTKLTREERINNGECAKDPGGYFIINGKERVLVAQIRNAHNRILVTPPRKAQLSLKFKLCAEIRSMSDETGHSILIQAMVGNDDRTVMFFFPNIGFIPVGIVFKALGYTKQEEILHLIGLTEEKATEILTFILRDSYCVQTEEQALEYISNLVAQSVVKGDKISYIREVMHTKLLPHMGITSSTKEQSMFLGHIVNKLLQTYIGLRKVDDIDNYNNKRFESAGVLFTELFRNLFKQYLKSLTKQLEKRPRIMDYTERMTRITSNIRHSMATGNWGPQKNTYIRTGVSQVVNRLSYASGLSYMRRVAIPMGKESKSTKQRLIHESSFGFVCPADCFAPETPILMWDGSIKRADEIEVGDHLIDDKGNSTEVYKTTSGVAQMYEILPKGGTPHVVTYNHILTLKIKNHNTCRTKRGKFEVMWFDKDELRYSYQSFSSQEEADNFRKSLDDDVIDIRLQKYLELPENVRKSMYCFYSDGVNWSKRQVSLDPYILGMWLGDGLSTCKGFATADKELLEYWIEWGKQNDAEVTHYDRYQYGISSTTNKRGDEKSVDSRGRPRKTTSINTQRNPLKKLLNEYNVVNNKHIPKDYLINDRDTRLKVLAGLIDTDGSVRANGHEIRITQGPKNKQVVHDAMFLAKSLGFKCNIREGISSWTTNGVKKSGTYTELSITGVNLYEIPTRLPRKKLYPFELPHSDIRVHGHMQVPFEVIKKDVTEFVGWQLKGSGRFLLPDFITSHNTPEGKMVGIVLNLSLLTKITRRIPTHIVKDVLEACDSFINVNNLDISDIPDYAKIFVNGTMVGFTEDPEDFVVQIRDFRETDLLDENVSVLYNTQDDEVHINCDEGRLIRPVFPVDKGELRIKRKDGINWDKLVKTHKITYIDPAEAESSFISTWTNEITEKNHYSEIHPAMMLGICASTIPYPDHSQSPRNTYQSAMSKQAMGIPYTSHAVRADTLAQVLHTPQRPLVQTKPANFMGFDELPSGQIAMVGIMLYSGFNQEDSVLLNKSSVQRGLFRASTFKTFKTDEDPTKSNITYRIQHPSSETQRKGINYSYLGKEPFNEDEFENDIIIRVGKRDINGIVKEGTEVRKGDAIIGKIVLEKAKGEEMKKKDCSVIIKGGEEGVVSRVYLTKTQKGQKLVKVVIEKLKIPEIGDKFAARSAQKGTCLVGDTLVSTSKGTSVRIKDLEIGSSVWGYKEGGGLQLSKCIDKAYMGEKNTLKLTLQTGDTIECTDDHRIMTKDGWKMAKDLKNTDMIMYNLPMPEDIISDDENGWTLSMGYSTRSKTNTLQLSMDSPRNRQRSLAFARILGLVLSDGWICGYKTRVNDYRGGVSLGTKIDSSVFIADMGLLLDDLGIKYKKDVRYYDSKSYAGACFIYDLPAFLSRCIASLPGMPTGKRILSPPSWPEFLYTAPKSILREFVGGLFGGDGTAPYITRNEIQGMEFKWKGLEDNTDQYLDHIEQLRIILFKIGIECTIITPQQRSSFAKDGQKRIMYGLSFKRNQNFLNKIGFRYCMTKQCKLVAAVSLLKMRKHMYNNQEGHFCKSQGETSQQWLSKIEATDFFIKGSHCVSREQKCIPYMYIPIDTITANGVTSVYDITVKHLESFIANGMVVHNCGMLLPQEDMPFVSNTGMPLDMLINSHCIPSRMTINQLQEMTLGKICCQTGEYGDATPFGKNSVDIAKNICSELGKWGFERKGTERLVCGMTGEMIEAAIYTGPTFYQRLKHMVDDKIHARARGNVTMLTRQPLNLYRAVKGDLKRVHHLVLYIQGKTPGCGNPLRALTTIFIWKLIKRTRLIAVPNGKKVRDWEIRRLSSKSVMTGYEEVSTTGKVSVLGYVNTRRWA